MDRLDAMALFVSAAEEGSLAAAARRHGRSPAAVTRAVALLERYAGEPLLLRSTRKIRLTGAGERHLTIWREVLSKLRDIEVDERTTPLQGQIALTAPELFGRLKVMPLVDEFLRLNNNIAARVLLLNRLVDLIGEGIDLAIRVASLPDSTLTAVKVGEVRALLCGSPDYLAGYGHPSTPQDLDRHECIGLHPEGDGEAWAFATPGQGRSVRSKRVKARLSVNNAAAAIDAARSGFGLVRVQSYQVQEDLAKGRLVRVMPEYEPPPMPLNLLFHPHAAARAPVRAFIEFAAPRLRRALSEELQLKHRAISA